MTLNTYDKVFAIYLILLAIFLSSTFYHSKVSDAIAAVPATLYDEAGKRIFKY